MISNSLTSDTPIPEKTYSVLSVLFGSGGLHKHPCLLG